MKGSTFQQQGSPRVTNLWNLLRSLNPHSSWRSGTARGRENHHTAIHCLNKKGNKKWSQCNGFILIGSFAQDWNYHYDRRILIKCIIPFWMTGISSLTIQGFSHHHARLLEGNEITEVWLLSWNLFKRSIPHQLTFLSLCPRYVTCDHPECELPFRCYQMLIFIINSTRKVQAAGTSCLARTLESCSTFEPRTLYHWKLNILEPQEPRGVHSPWLVPHVSHARELHDLTMGMSGPEFRTSKHCLKMVWAGAI